MTTNEDEARRTLVLRDRRDESGVSWRGVTLLDDGGLEISGHDLGAAVEGHWGYDEYEFSRRLTHSEVARLRALLGVGSGDDLLATIRSRFPETSALEAFLHHNEIAGQFWSRVGD